VEPQHPEEERWAVIARVVGPRGNRGEVQAISLSDRPGRFQDVGEVYLFRAAQPEVAGHCFSVENAWEHKGRIILKFRGVDSISEAERWRDCEVRVPLSGRPALPPGEYYQSDLVGCEVVERTGGQRVGSVRSWQESSGTLLLKVEAENGGEILIPFAGSICVEVDPGARRIVVELPEGLKDLNR
jgi:16S rRNA processing protein RimM